MFGRVGDPLQNRPEQVAPGVGEVQSDQAALGKRILQWRPFAGEIGCEHQPVGAGRRGLCLIDQGHGALVESVLLQEGILGVGQHIHDGVAHPDDVVLWFDHRMKLLEQFAGSDC